MSKRFDLRKILSEITFADFLRPFDMFDSQFQNHTSQVNSQRDICMGAVEKTRCHQASLRAGARFSNPKRVENNEIEVEVEGKDQCARF